MYNEPLFLEPVLQERIWGGKKLQTEFGYSTPYERTGEAWVISAHPNGPCQIKNGPLEGRTLQDAWENHKELFNRAEAAGETYPLLVKILDANENLSVQVHPDDIYAQKQEGVPYGKTECWYVLDAEEGAELILGHHANSREELKKAMENGEWDTLLKSVPVTAGDFVYVPSGTIHAIGAGIVILETQQSSDITYRVYDYDRTDANGEPRELHLEQAAEVTNVPHEDPSVGTLQEAIEDLTVQKLVEETYFTVYHWDLQGDAMLERDKDFLQVSVIKGAASITIDDTSFAIEKGDHFVIPHTVKAFSLKGNAEMVVSHT
ncbi:mannose-6-phosphate isomerase, class I [Oceanobacillus oncorhynchi subsp. incaldanensis]|uniref:mannose-6-phosphate isomerase, class I n=1 Tax=Oceanobacillus oncorhynchi TaxID=545501 RepID=UPI001B0A513F|nr:mannose-6-phosphate isomerase, class I [Oceanobacillus oncorhynchi]GIO19527.1 mannose-6-phosphate isomerase, class I [Oceanobacillus oncorhynchi subsp. incaldanensis]